MPVAQKTLLCSGSDTPHWATPQQVCLPEPTWDLSVSIPPSRPAWTPTSPGSCSDAPCSTPHYCLVALSKPMALQIHHSEKVHERKGKHEKKRAYFSYFLERCSTCVLFLHYMCVCYLLGNFLDFMFLFFGTFFSYISHVSFYICCIVLFSISWTTSGAEYILLCF